MMETLQAIYGDDSKAYESLEIIKILIHKLCHIAYGAELPNKVAMNIALRILLDELPEGTIKANYSAILDAIFHVLNISHE